jgi:hypothetical protein
MSSPIDVTHSSLTSLPKLGRGTNVRKLCEAIELREFN